MSQEKLDTPIQNKEELLSFFSRMENLRLEFVQETVDFAMDWYYQTSRLYVIKFSEVTLNMTEERLCMMKTKVDELVKNASKIVNAELSNPELWWHKRPKVVYTVNLYTQISNKYPEILDRAVRHILGRLGVILEEFGYNVTTKGNFMVFPEFWFDSTSGHSIVPYFPHSLEWSKDMQYTIVKYNEQFTLALELFKKTQVLKDQKIKLQASLRWDTAPTITL